MSRLLVAYISTGVVFMLLPGTFLGVWLIPISAKQAAAQVSAAWSQAHGHAQQAEDWHGITIPVPHIAKGSCIPLVACELGGIHPMSPTSTWAGIVPTFRVASSIAAMARSTDSVSLCT